MHSPEPMQPALQNSRGWLAALRQMALADGDFSLEEEVWLANHLQSSLPSAELHWHLWETTACRSISSCAWRCLWP